MTHTEFKGIMIMAIAFIIILIVAWYLYHIVKEDKKKDLRDETDKIYE